jgi:outer membrane protein OmpA-like peptidoglycan-associated protein
MSYCANCGTQLHEGQDFCPDCGTAVRGGTAAFTGTEPVTPPAAAPVADFPVRTSQGPGSAAAQADREASLHKLATLSNQTPPPTSKSGNKVLLAILTTVLLGGVAVVGGGVYIGYKVKQKASAALNKLEGKESGNSSLGIQKVTSDDFGNKNSSDSSDKSKGDGNSGGAGDNKDNPLSSLLGKLQGGDQTTSTGNMMTSILEDAGVKNPNMPPDLVRNIPYAAVKTPLPCPTGADIDPAKLANGKIQIKPGTTLTNSWSLPKGDAESDEKIQSVSPERLQFQFDGIAAHNLAKGDNRKHVIFDNTVCGKDVATGQAFATGWYFDKNDATPGLYPGLTRILLPAARFADLKSTGSLSLVFGWYDYMDVLTEWELLAWKGKLTRVEQGDVPFPLIINDERVDVPAIHVRGQMKVLETAGRFGSQDQPADAYILDDPNAPIVLSWLFGKDLHQDDAFRVQYIRVRYGDKPTIEQKLTKQRKAITYGINFDYNSAAITPQSEPVLQEIARAMADKPDWKLTITGHTDNIGGHKYNLALSQRRSASVKQALVERYHVNPNRLSTGGDGDADPIDTNDTLEGRARNRRVELTLD